MNKYRICILFLMVLLSLMTFSDRTAVAETSQADDPPEASPGAEMGNGGGGITSLAGSFVVFDPSAGGDAFYIPGETQTFCFRTESYTPDWEFVYDIWLKFPGTWTVSDVYVQGTPTCDSGASWGTFSWSFHTSPYEVDIYHPRYHALTDHCVATYCVEVTSIAGSDPVPVSWYFDGDNYGSTPHWPCSSDIYTPSGETTCDQALNPPANIPTYTSWKQIATDPNPRMDSVLAAYQGKVWNITGQCAPDVSVYTPATDTWVPIPGTLPPFGPNFAHSGCQIGNKVYMYGDVGTPGFTGLWSYNMDTSAWTQETPGGTPPPLAALWAPAWVADPETKRCYLTGGSTITGGGNQNSVYVYHAATNQWLAPLPSFTTIRNFHAAFLFSQPPSGRKLLCVAGGLDIVNTVWNSTQCYDFTAGVWNAENADLGTLPLQWWGMGYAQRPTATGDQLWMIGGATGGMAVYNQTWFYDVTTNSWVNMSHLASGNVYRTSAVTLDDIVFHVGGSTGSFNCVGLSDKNGPVLNINPVDLEVTMMVDDDPLDVSISLYNGEPIPYRFTLTEKDEGFHPFVNIPAFTGELQEDTRPTSSGLAPTDVVGSTGETSLFGHLRSMDPAYGIRIYPLPEELVNFPDTAAPGSWDVIGGTLFTFPSGGDFINNDFSTLYAVNYNASELYTIDINTGNAALVSTTTTPPSGQWTGLSGTPDGTLYGLSSTLLASNLVTINPNTGAVTNLGNLAGIPCGIDLAYNTSEGMIYIVDICSDHLFRVDPNTLAVTDVGSLGVGANYAQSMDYDEASGILYWAAYTSQGELRVIDMHTGASALVDAFPGGADIDCFAFKTEGSWDVPWLSEEVVSGIVTEYTTRNIEVTFDPGGLQEGDHLATLQIKDWPFPEFDLPVILHVQYHKRYLPIFVK